MTAPAQPHQKAEQPQSSTINDTFVWHETDSEILISSTAVQGSLALIIEYEILISSTRDASAATKPESHDCVMKIRPVV